MLYYKYSDYLKNKYGEKVYKLPVNLPVTCPNRLDGDGCAFCAGAGTGFEAMSAAVSVTEQLTRTRQMITRKYHANKYIAYFQNYTNTFLPPDRFRSYLMEATRIPGVVEISVSTRPDCVSAEYLDIMRYSRNDRNSDECRTWITDSKLSYTADDRQGTWSCRIYRCSTAD